MIRSLMLAASLAGTPVAAGNQATPPAVQPKPEAAVEEVTYAFLKAPLFSDQFASFPIAMVGEDAILGQELVDAIVGAHGTHDPKATAGKTDYTPLLERLINVRLLVSEAREMGIDDLPEVKEQFAAARAETGRQLLQEKAMAGTKADPATVERVYQAAVREWKVASVMLNSEDAARKLVAEVKAGKDFGALVTKLVADKKGQGGGEAEFLPRAKLQPQVLAALEATKVGALSAPTRVKDGWAVMKVVEVRYPEDPKARAEVEKQVLAQRRQAALEKYYTGIIKRYATVDQPLLKSLDYEAKVPGLAALRKDQRVIARIKGGKDVTVADFSAELTGGFYHGAANAVAEKKANREKNSRFDGLLSSRIVPLEVKATGIPESAAFKAKVAALDRQILFGKFLEKAILPELKYSEEQLQKYYDAHLKEFASPGFYRLEALAFAGAKAAQAAVDKLRSGTDFKWLAANADGQVLAKERKLNLDGGLYIATALPRALADTLGGVAKGDYRLFTDESPATYAIHVIDVVPPAVKPFTEVRGEIATTIFNTELVKAVETWAGKLRPSRDVKVYISRIGS
jgi:PPIC-type PPIASE domain